ncbi:Inosine-5'-monophosphate dehydrogenase [Mannheimia haemolytica]|uniref:Inosine-5'-monophosphate dehydrogenase n=1 Tax=Mannheimia haemolytica TaxID=75985 RepID=A0A378N1C4_MANHA|nr:Inosine-5'-monophosphate dehydrogenase [Mannheimia haemolytica]
MITLKDYQKAESKPNACKDEFGRLRVGAAVGAGPGNEERIDALSKSGCRCAINRLFARAF